MNEEKENLESDETQAGVVRPSGVGPVTSEIFTSTGHSSAPAPDSSQDTTPINLALARRSYPSRRGFLHGSHIPPGKGESAIWMLPFDENGGGVHLRSRLAAGIEGPALRPESGLNRPDRPSAAHLASGWRHGIGFVFRPECRLGKVGGAHGSPLRCRRRGRSGSGLVALAPRAAACPLLEECLENRPRNSTPKWHPSRSHRLWPLRRPLPPVGRDRGGQRSF